MKHRSKIPFYFFFLLILCSFSAPVNEKPGSTAGKKLIYVFELKQEIFPAAWRYTQKAFKEAEAMGAKLIIIHMNTYGGLLDVADSIRTRILNSRIPVYVFIDNNAASAGALISIAADRIYMRKGANIGAATVVSQNGEKMPDKYQSYMRGLMRATAESHGKDTLINGSDTVFHWKRDPKIAEGMVDEDVFIEAIKDTGKILTFTTDEAVKNGYCEGIAENIPEVLKLAGEKDYVLAEYHSTGIDNLISILMNPFVHGLLIMFIIGGIYFELQAPGIGFALGVAVFAALLYFAPLYLEGLAANWEILIFIAGLILLGLEIFVIPGFGVAGISGIILIIVGLTLAMVDNIVFEFDGFQGLYSIMEASTIVVVAIALSFFLSIFISKQLFTNTKTFGKLALDTVQKTEQGFIGVEQSMKDMVGKTGIAQTILRPSGKVLIEGEVFDAMSLIAYIDQNTTIRVVKFETGQLYVLPYVQKN
jgi:membrane-bound serine protease (ClpP class)